MRPKNSPEEFQLPRTDVRYRIAMDSPNGVTVHTEHENVYIPTVWNLEFLMEDGPMTRAWMDSLRKAGIAFRAYTETAS